ncbi:MAG: VWA domain-containing protein [Planctomycetota bacterium]|jgi:Ca-activated chloride channel family protein
MNDLLESLTGLRLLDPWLLSLGVLLLLGLVLRFLRGRPAINFAPGPLVFGGPDRSNPSGKPTGILAHARAFPRTWRQRLLAMPRILQVLGLLLAVIALARPVQRDQLPLETKGIDIFLCLDVSSSMAADDMDRRRSRLEVAKDAATEFISGRSQDRIGLVSFARFPDLLCPLTLDHAALNSFLDELEMVEADGDEDMTGVGTAVARAAQVLQGSEANSKVIILLTDGEENVATLHSPDEIGPLQAGRLCEQLGIRVYSIAAGIGKQGPDGEFVPLDTNQLRGLASISGGEFYEARDAGAVASVYTYINELEKIEFEEPRFEMSERFMPFLLGAIVLLLLSRILNSTWLEVLP